MSTVSPLCVCICITVPVVFLVCVTFFIIMFFFLFFLFCFFFFFFFFFQAEDGIRDDLVTGVQTCALPISFRNRLAVAGENHRIRAGIAKARGVAFIAIVQRVMCVFDRGHAHAARDEARDQLDDERRLSSSRPAGDRNRVHLPSLC